MLDDIKLNLNMCFKNIEKSLVLIGSQAGSVDEQSSMLYPDVLIKCELPALNINITPDVYNGLVNLSKILSSVNATEDLRLMKEEKERLLLTAVFKGEILTRGVIRSKIYWEEYFMIVAG